MPYIKIEDRIRIELLHPEEINLLENGINIIELLAKRIETEGELNFVISSLIKFMILKKEKSYATFNSVIGVLECAKLEFYRRKVAPYEDEAIKRNGDV
jgi:hypothetical protein